MSLPVIFASNILFGLWHFPLTTKYFTRSRARSAREKTPPLKIRSNQLEHHRGRLARPRCASREACFRALFSFEHYCHCSLTITESSREGTLKIGLVSVPPCEPVPVRQRELLCVELLRCRTPQAVLVLNMGLRRGLPSSRKGISARRSPRPNDYPTRKWRRRQLRSPHIVYTT